jgi:hypothetical protein
MLMELRPIPCTSTTHSVDVMFAELPLTSIGSISAAKRNILTNITTSIPTPDHTINVTEKSTFTDINIERFLIAGPPTRGNQSESVF